MRIETLAEISADLKERTHFFLLSTQDYLVENLRLDEDDFEAINGALVYKSKIELRYDCESGGYCLNYPGGIPQNMSLRDLLETFKRFVYS